MIRVKLKGLQKAIRNLESWQTDRIKDAARAVERSSLNVEREAKNAAPVDTGRLRSDIQRAVTKTEAGRVIAAQVGNSVEYAPFVEFGTGLLVDVPAEQTEYAAQFKGKTGAVVNRRARPYLFPAWERERPRLVEELIRVLKK